MTEKFKNIQLVIYDFDGVMTDNRVLVLTDGTEGVFCNRSDGLAVGMIRKKGIEQIIVTTETNKCVDARAKKLNLPLIKGCDDKKKAVEEYCRKEDIDLSTVVYVGNDLNDLEVMKTVGFPVCPADAFLEIQQISRVVLGKNGGDGVIRDLVKLII